MTKTDQESCAYDELSPVVATHTKLVQAQSSSHLSMERVIGHTTPPPGVRVIDSCQLLEKEVSVFSKSVAPGAWITLQRKTTYPKASGAAQLGLERLQEKRYTDRWLWRQGTLEKLGGDDIIKTCTNLSKN